MHFSTSSFVFFKPPNLQSHRHGQCFEHFSCFPLLCFFVIFCWKNRPKMEPWKNVEKQALPASKMVPKALRIHAPNPENPENGLQNLNFEKSIFLMIFEVSKKQYFWQFWVPKLKRRRSLFGDFFDIFRFFLRFWLLLRFWLIFLAQGDQKCRKNDEKTSLTAKRFWLIFLARGDQRC